MRRRVGFCLAMTAVVLACGVASAQTLEVHFIDVGQGDAILIDYGTYELLIDGGRGSACVSFLETSGLVDGALDVLVATHMDADHIGGLDDVLARYVVAEIWTNGNTHTTATYDSFIAAVNAERCPVRTGRKDDTILLGDLLLNVLHPDHLVSDRNSNSLVILLEHRGWSYLFSGDIDSNIEERLVSNGLGDVDILKIAHHGSAHSTSAAFLDATEPQVCVISVGSNSYGHPTEEVLDRLGCELNSAMVFRTDTHGSVVLLIDEEGDAYYRTELDVNPLAYACDSIGPPPPPPAASFGIYSVEAIAECITIINNGAIASDLGGWSISDGEGSYTFPYGTIIAVGGVHKVCMDVYNPTHYTRGLYLNNDSDCVLLFAPGSYETVDSRCW